MNPVEMVLSGMSARRRMHREDEEAADRERRRRQEQEDRDFTMAERARAQKVRDDLAAAAAPTTVDDAPVAAPIGSRDEPRAPEDIGVRAAGKTFTDRAAAERAAAEYNSPQSMVGRQAQVLAQAGDVKGAQDLRTGLMQERAAALKLSEAERQALDDRFNADLDAGVTSWEGFDKFTSESAGDGFGGKIKLQTTVSSDGKTRIVNIVAPDGTLKPTGQTFPNDGDGLAMAKAELSRMTPDKKLAHLYQKEQMRRQAAAQQSTERYQQGMLEAARDRTAADVELKQARAEAAMLRARGAGGGAGGGGSAPAGPAGLSMADADKFINTLFTTKDDMAGKTVFDPKGAQAVRGLMLRMPAAQQGDTQGAVNQALTVYNRYIQLAGGDHDKAMQLIQQAMLSQQSAPAAPAGSVAQQPAAPARTAAPAPAAPAAPAQPGMFSRAAEAISGMLRRGAEEGRQMEAIRARVREADNGGRPLTADERAQAKKFGIAPTS